MFYPFSTELQGAVKAFSKGNFSLWFNKLVPLNNAVNCKACDRKGDDREVVAYYKSEYDGMKKNSTLKNLLAHKHADQTSFCENYRKSGCEAVLFSAELRTPLITGIGQTHPNEVGMVFDHTMGIPYIPASTIKGIVRLAHTIGLINSEGCEEYIDGDDLDESNRKTMIPDLFGGDLVERTNGKQTTKKLKGEVVFLDAYPARVPDLHTAIMNPHYGAYYSDPDGKISPADHLEPNPIKFLTVSSGTTFIFRALVPKNSGLKQHVINAYETAFTVEGIGAKTAVGYGRFAIKTGADENSVTSEKEFVAHGVSEAKTPLDKMLGALTMLKSSEIGRISGEIINNMDKNLSSEQEKTAVAKAIKEKIGPKAFKKLDKKKNGYLSGLIGHIKS